MVSDGGRPWRPALLVAVVAALAVAGYGGYELYPRFNLPPAEGAGLLLLAAGAGIAAFFSPCAFPLLVTMLTGAPSAPDAGRWESLRASLGFAAAMSFGAALFVLLAGIAVAAGGAALLSSITFASPAGRALRLGAGLVLVALGLAQLGAVRNPLQSVAALAHPLERLEARLRRRHPLIASTAFGFGYLLAGFG